ncbi:piRNA biogenesis protein EXD1 [Periplaneta americana]|uniref:piRNA biogenesis protein EXD1 n=1 Tax=Periplaneta americana TaxID=6978 RepID=UPI0037E82FBE
MDEDYCKGQRLFLETLDGTVEGVFHSMDPGHNKMTLKQVILHPSGEKIDGLYHYYRNEVLCVRILEPGSYTGVDTTNEAAGNWNLMRKTESSVISNKLPARVVPADVVMNCKPGYGQNRQSVSNRKTNLSEEEYDELNKLLHNYVFIDRVGDVFKRAIQEIREEPAVGVSVEGAVFGRRSKIGVITIVTPKWAFLFDIHTLGDEMFNNGLRDILESKNIEKVMHNCRLVSDCLHHKHKVTIDNVFDTQVGDLTVMQQKYGQFPRTVSSLPQCLTKYLHLPENLIHQPQIRAGYMVVDVLKWIKRPLSIELRSAAVKNGIYLLHLKKRILAEMMNTFHQCVNLFLNVVRDADQQEASEHQANDTLVPLEVLSFNNPRSQMTDKEVVRNGV